MFAFWRKGEASSGGKLVATSAFAETPSADPAPTGGQVVVHVQRMLEVASDGTFLDPATTATPLAPLTTVNGTTWVLAVDLAGLRGCELQNDSDQDFLYCHASTQPANSSDFGLKLRKGANRFFAPPRDRSYAGKVWVRALAGSDKMLRRVTW